MIYFKSERMIFRSWHKEDLKTLKKINKSKVVMKHYNKTLSDKESEAFYNNIKKDFDDTGYGLYAVELKETKEFIGFLGFHRPNYNELSSEMTCRFKSSVWNKGLASEGSKACLEYGFNILRLEEITSCTSITNINSESVMRKIGLRKLKEFNCINTKEDKDLNLHILYGLTRAEFKKKESSYYKKTPSNIINYLLG